MWQNLNPVAGYSSFFEMCDTIEGARDVNVSDVYLNGTSITTTNSHTTTATRSNMPPLYNNNNTSPEVPSSGVGLEKALANFAAWYKNEELPGGENDFRHRWMLHCANTTSLRRVGVPRMGRPSLRRLLQQPQRQQPNVYRLVRRGALGSPVGLDAVQRALCVLAKVGQSFPFLRARLTTYSGPPPFHRGLMSRVVSTDYFQRQCELMFPPTPNGTTYGSADGVRTTNTLNQLTGGWNFGNTTHVLWTVGYVLSSPAEQSRADGGTASSTPGAMPRSPALYAQAARWPLPLPTRYS